MWPELQKLQNGTVSLCHSSRETNPEQVILVYGSSYAFSEAWWSNWLHSLAEISFQLRRGMATESYYANFIYRAGWFPVLWAGCLFSCLGLGGFAAQRIFVSELFWPWKDVWPGFTCITLMKATEVSREPEQATCGALSYPTLMATGEWVLLWDKAWTRGGFFIYAMQGDNFTECDIDLLVLNLQGRASSPCCLISVIFALVG